MNKIDISNLFELGMENLEGDKVVNPHCLFLLISTVAIHIILMWRNNTTISQLLKYHTLEDHILSIFLGDQPIWFLVLLLNNFQEMSAHCFMKKWISIFWFLETYHFLTCFQTWLPFLWIETCLPREQVRWLHYVLYKHQKKAPWTDNLSQTGQTLCPPWQKKEE